MAGGNQLVINVGANTDKLRADLALAQADVTAFGKELRTAAQEARDTGDYTKVQELASKYEDARKSALGLNQEIRNAKGAGDDSGGSGGWLAGMTAAWGRMRSAMTPVMEEAKGHFNELHAAATKFGNAVSNTASSIFPHFRDILAIGTIGGAAGFLAMIERTAEWAHNIELTSQRLGLSITEVGSLAAAAKATGVDFDHLVEATARLGSNVEKAAETQKKVVLGIVKDIAGKESPLGASGPSVFRGSPGEEKGAKNTADSVAQMGKVIQAASVDLTKYRDDLTGWFKLLEGEGLKPAASAEQFIGKISAALAKGGDSARSLRQELAKVGIELPVKTIGEQAERLEKGFSDPFTKMRITLIKATGEFKGPYEALGDFAEKIKNTHSPTERLALVSETLGKRYTDLIPLLAKGRDNIQAVANALKASGADTSEFEKEVGKGNELFIRLNQFKTAISSLQRSFVLPFADVFTPMVEGLDKALKGNKEKVSEFARGIATTLRPIAEDIGKLFKGEAPTKGGFVEYLVSLKQTAIDAIGYIRGGFEGLIGILDNVAKSMNSIFGTNLSGKGLLIAGVIIHLTGILPAFSAGIVLASAAFKALRLAMIFLYTNPIVWAITAIVLGALLIYENWDKIAPLFEKIWEIIQRVAVYVGGAFVAAWNEAVDGIKSAWSGLTSWISGQINQILGFIDKVVSVAQKAASIIASLGGGSAAPSAGTGGGYSGDLGGASGGSGGFAGGGYIRGPGGPTDDKVALWGSNGEYIVNAAQTAKHLPLLHAINSGAKFAMGGLVNIAGYAMGGLVGSFSPSLPSFAGGGLVGSGGSFGTVNLTIGGQTVGLNVSNQDGFGQLSRIARSEQRTSAGAKPSWYGS